MNSKSDFLLETMEKLVCKSSDFGVDLVICGGLVIHILSDVLKRDSPRPWNHKDIDFVVPLPQFSKAIPFFKSLGYIKVFVPYKKRRIVKNHVRFGKNVNNTKILVDIYGTPKVSIIKTKRNNIEFLLLSPRVELENWKDREQREGSKPSIDLSIDFLKCVVAMNLFEEEELT